MKPKSEKAEALAFANGACLCDKIIDLISEPPGLPHQNYALGGMATSALRAIYLYTQSFEVGDLFIDSCKEKAKETIIEHGWKKH